MNCRFWVMDPSADTDLRNAVSEAGGRATRPEIRSTSTVKSAAIFYATREGHTRRIADAIASRLRHHGVETLVFDVADGQGREDLRRCSAIVLAAPVHAGNYAPEAVAFAREHCEDLNRAKTSVFVSVTLSEAGVERADASPTERAKFADDVAQLNERFFRMTGWRPAHVQNVAGALAYSRYRLPVRLMMRWIAKRAGASTDTRRDHDYTDWEALDAFADGLASGIAASDVSTPARHFKTQR